MLTTYLAGAAAIAGIAWVVRNRRPASFAALVPTAEVRDGVVLNVDGSLALGFKLSPIELTSSSAEALATLAAQIAGLLRRVPDGAGLQIVMDIEDRAPDGVKRFVERRVRRVRSESAADALGRDIAHHLDSTTFRTTRLVLFVCLPYEFQSATLGRAGMAPRDRPRWSRQRYAAALTKLEQLAATVGEQLCSAGLRVARASDEELLALVSSHLNPGAPLSKTAKGKGEDALGDREVDPIFTLRERLASTSASMPTPRFLEIGDSVVRSVSLHSLPDATSAGMLAPLFFELSGPARVSLYVERMPTEATLAALKVRRSIAQGVSSLSPSRNIDAEVQNAEIESVMQALSQSSACLASLQISCAVRGDTPEEVNARVLRLQEGLSRAGGFGTLIEDHAHLEAYLSMLPGAMHRFRRARTVLDSNAAELLIPFGSWPGSTDGPLMLRTRAGDPLLFNPFDQRLPSYNGFVVGPMGSGKSFVMNLLLASHVANGGAAVIIDIGGSYRRLTQLFDGTYIDIGRTEHLGLNPLCSVAELARLSDEKRDEKLQFLAGFLELLLSEQGAMPTSERALVTKLVSAFYSAPLARERLEQQPTLADLQRFIVEHSGDGVDREGAMRLARRLDLWTQGPRARLFSRPVDLSIAPSLISIDLKAIESDKELQAVALYVLAFIIWSKVADDRRDTLVVIDECWALLDNPAAVRLIESLVRTSRKYGAALWCLTQRAQDLLQSGVGKVLVDCAFQRVFLQHAAGHEEIASAFGFTDHEVAAFESLQQVKGRYSEAFLQVQHHSEVVQIVPSPLAYWMATTNARDKAVEEQLKAKNPTSPTLKILQTLAERLPHGVPT